jgi:AcrR family transcriptional regulator
MPTTPRRRPYHHGNLPAALVDAALDLIGESGVQGFSVAEAARRTGVSISAPYRHFADRDELIAACAVAACEELQQRFEAAVAEPGSPAEQLAAASAAYVRFAAERRPMFDALFGAGLDKTKYPQLEAAAADVVETVFAVARRLAPRGDDRAAGVLVEAMTALAQGHATLLLEGSFGEMPEAVDLASERVAAAMQALIRGRSLLFGDREPATARKG